MLSCASDDQKAVKSRLMQMKEFVDRTTEGSNEEDKISPAKKVKDGE